MPAAMAAFPVPFLLVLDLMLDLVLDRVDAVAHVALPELQDSPRRWANA
jgi:hypothetical protein